MSDRDRRSPTSFDYVLLRWCSCNMMMSTTLPNKYSSRSLLSFHLFCWSNRLLSPCTFHVIIFILMEWGERLPIVPGALHNKSWVGSTHHLDIQSFPGMECWSKSKSGVFGLSGELQSSLPVSHRKRRSLELFALLLKNAHFTHRVRFRIPTRILNVFYLLELSFFYEPKFVNN